MKPIIYIYILITIYIIWLFWDIKKMYRKDSKDRKDGSEYKKVKSRIHSEYKDIGQTILNCDSPELLSACYQQILIFRNEYKGRYAEELCEDLFALLEQKDLELA